MYKTPCPPYGGVCPHPRAKYKQFEKHTDASLLCPAARTDAHQQLVHYNTYAPFY